MSAQQQPKGVVIKHVLILLVVIIASVVMDMY